MVSAQTAVCMQSYDTSAEVLGAIIQIMGRDGQTGIKILSKGGKKAPKKVNYFTKIFNRLN